MEIVEKMPLIEWMANNYKRFGTLYLIFGCLVLRIKVMCIFIFCVITSIYMYAVITGAVLEIVFTCTP